MSAPGAVQEDHSRPSPQAGEVLTLMVSAAREAADFIRRRTDDRAGLEWRSKAPADFVSDVDTGAERVIRDALLTRIPEARVIGEELSPGAALDARTVFVVDPLDGTTNFLHGYPEYAVSIAALLDGVLSAGVVLNVPTGELFTATRGGGAFKDGAPIAVSQIDDPVRALVGTGFPFRVHDQLPVYLRQLEAVARSTAGIRRAGSAALDLCDVASGRFEAFWELSLSPWDFAAGMLIIREAGGLVTTAAGGDVPIAPSSILAGNRAMHEWLLETVSGSGKRG